MKHRLFTHCHNLIEERIATLELQLNDLRIGAESEGKSTAGDKHETGRAMMQLEQEQLQKQIGEFKQQAQILLSIRNATESDTIQQGSLVHTNLGLIYIAIGLGKIMFEDQTVFVISAASPLGKAFIGKMSGDEVRFGNQVWIVG